MIITPITIKINPTIAGRSIDCLKTIVETTAVNTIPKPAHIAYATPNGINFKARDKK